MKLLVSDYDGTIEIFNSYNFNVPNGTISEIEQFMNSGNKFMIATARSYKSIMEKINKYHIPYDFISTFNGSIIYDNQGNILFSNDLEELERIFSYFKSVVFLKEKDRTLYFLIYTKLLEYLRSFLVYFEEKYVFTNSDIFNKLQAIKPFSDKIDSVKFIQNLLGIDDCDVITIGDDTSDLEMIKRYNGYGVSRPFPNHRVLETCNTKVKSLYDLLHNKKI